MPNFYKEWGLGENWCLYIMLNFKHLALGFQFVGGGAPHYYYIFLGPIEIGAVRVIDWGDK